MIQRRVAVIGSNGFIARHLVRKLQSEPGIIISLFGRSHESYFGNSLPYKQMDFDDEKSIQRDFSEIDLIYHLVSATIPSSSWEDPMVEIEKNLIPFTRLLKAITKTSVKKIAFVSSAGTVYGPSLGKVNEESDKRPFSPYGIFKLTMENLLRYYQARRGLQYDVFRVSNVYGEGQDTAKGLGIVNTFIENIIRTNTVRVFGDGKSTRNYIYVKDVADLLCISLRDLGSSAVYNISSNSTLNINELIEILRKITGLKFNVAYEESRQSDNSYIDLDNSRILSRFPAFRFTGMEEGLKQTYGFISKKHNKEI